MKKLLITIALMLGATTAYAENIDISGTVESRCTVNTDTPGYYGNPNAYTLTTLPASAGQEPIVRFDVTLADAYFAQVSYPTSFSSSPSLPDTVSWTGEITVDQTGSADMSGYQAASTTAGSMRQYALAFAGATWFKSTSIATYGGGQNKAFPGGAYKAVVLAECIAQ
jgi:hypothetical protein|tara:strand:+ start:1100 stop:1603 length:504 start_codon:yes stop_codon:yes gene_type:complete